VSVETTLVEELRAAGDSRTRRGVVRRLAPDAVRWNEVLAECKRVRREDPSQAAMLARQALAAARRGRDVARRFEAARALGQAHHLLGEPATAVRRLREAYGHATQQQRAVMASDLAGALALLGRAGEARELIAAARRGLRGPTAPRLRVGLDIAEATLLERGDRHAEALALLERARASLKRMKHAAGLAAVDHNRANVLANLAQFDPAERIFRRVTAWHNARGETAAALQSEYNRTYVMFLRGRFHEALRRLRDLREAFRETADARHVALCDLDEAELLLHLNLFSDARVCAERSQGVFAALGLAQDAARARFFAVAAARNLEVGDAVGRELEACQQDFERLGLDAWSALALARLAEVDRDAGRLEVARARAEEAALRLRQVGLTDRACRAEVTVARTLLAEGRAPEARRRLAAVARVMGPGAHPWVRCELFHAMAQVSRALGLRWSALRAGLRAVRIVERHRVTVPPDEYMASFLRDKTAVYEEAARSLLELGGDKALVRSWQLAEQARSRALLDLLERRGRAPREAGASKGARRITELEGQIDALWNDLPAGEGRQRSGDMSLRAGLVRAREGWLSACLDRLEAVNPRAARTRRPTLPSLARLTASLGTDTTMVEYMFTDGGLCAFVLSAGRLEMVQLGTDRDALRALVERARFHLERPESFRDAHGAEGAEALALATGRILSALHEAVLGPLRSRLTTPRLLIVPHGLLHEVPFHALESGGRALIDDHEVLLTPSASIWLSGRPRSEGENVRALVLGVPDERAPLIAEEVRRVGAIHRGSRMVLGAAADRAALARLGRSARLVHLACHASYREGEPLLSGLLLSDGWLTLPEIYDLDLDADVLVLSGCATGRSSISEGGELFGLARGFLHAGARALVASLWPVSDASAAIFMQSFHRALAHGVPAAGALRTATLETRERLPHPHDWAPFILLATRAAEPAPISRRHS